MKNLKKIISVASILIVSLSMSCAKKTESGALKSSKGDLSDLPSWVLDPSVKDGVGGVGIASPSKGGIKFQLPKAELDAKANIAATIQSERHLHSFALFRHFHLERFRRAEVEHASYDIRGKHFARRVVAHHAVVISLTRERHLVFRGGQFFHELIHRRVGLEIRIRFREREQFAE